MGSITSDSNPINFENIWYVCKYCRRAYQHKHQLSEHKKAKHLDLIIKAYNERKLKKKLEEEKEKLASTVLPDNNENSPAVSSPPDPSPMEDLNENENENENEEQKEEKVKLTRLPILASLDAASAKQEGSRRDESDTEIEIVFDSHRPLASPMKPLSPNTVEPSDSNEISSPGGKKRRHSSSSNSSSQENSSLQNTELISLNSPEYGNLGSVGEIVSKIGVLGKIRYCSKCLKSFHRPSSLHLHQKLCHLKKIRSLEEFKSTYQIQMVSCKSSSYPTLIKIQPSFNCKLCGEGFHEKLELTSHLRYHMDKKVAPVLAGKKKGKKRVWGAGYRNFLHRQLGKHDLEMKPIRCSCLKAVSLGGLLRKGRFYRFHTKGRMFRCPMCSQKFRSKAEFSPHIYSHARKRPVRRNLHYSEGMDCKLCYKTFRDLATLRMHLRKHSFSPLKFPPEINMI